MFEQPFGMDGQQMPGMDGGVPQPDIAQLLQQIIGQPMQPMAPPPPPDLLSALAARDQQAAVQGWGGPTTMPPPGAVMDPASLRTVANTAGYAGPLRESDRPGTVDPSVMVYRGSKAESAVPPEEMAQRLRQQQIPGVGNAGELMDLQKVIGQLPKEVQAAILQQRMPGLKIADKGGDVLQRQMALAEYKDSLIRRREGQKPLSAEVQKKLNFLDELQSGAEIIDQIVRSGAHAPYVGLGSDLTYNVKRRIGGTDQEEVDLRQNLAKLTNVSIYTRSGVATNKEEALRIIAELPDTADEGTVFARKFENWKKALERASAQTAKTATMSREDLRKEGTQGTQVAKPGAPVATPTQLPKGRIPMIGPDGRVGHVPAEQVQQALQQGFRPYQK